MPSKFNLFKRKKKDDPEQAVGSREVASAQGSHNEATDDEAEEVCGLFDFDDDPPSEALFDIVAVHGLGGHWKHTWTGDSGSLWLRDFLPTEFKSLGFKVRIRSYGYNSNTAFSKAVTDLSNEAEMLLDRIRGERGTEEEKSRPILFVAHSLGGILVKKAMIAAHERSEIYGDILKKIHGVAFFGTPHRGSDLAWWADFPATLVKALQLGRGTNKAYVEALKRNSKEFSDISRQWVERAKGLRIRTYYETERLLGFLVVDEDSARLNLPNEIPTGIAGANHKTICKFDKENGQKYRQIWNGIKEIAIDISEARKISKASKETTNDTNIMFEVNEQHKQFLRLLCSSDYEADRRRNPEREQGTCEWIANDDHYQTWFSEKRSNILWISGDPGCGKSVAASYLVDHIRSSAEGYTPVFFFFKDDSERQSSANMALCAILHQILSIDQNKPLLELAMPVYTSHGSALLERFDSLWSILIKVVSDPRCGELVVVLDALDECAKKCREQFMTNMVALCIRAKEHDNENPTRVKFLLTSRPYAEVERALKNFQAIRLKTEESVDKIEQDVKRVIDARIQRFADRMEVSEDTRLKSLKKNLHSKADRTFLWVSLTLDMLDNSEDCTYAELADIVNASNPGIDALYEKILQKAKDPKKAQRMLHLVVGAVEPLSVEEINVAWAIEVGKECDLEHRKFPSPERGIREVCGLFVRIINKRVVLVHQTARDFLVQDPGNGTVERAPGVWKHCLEPSETNRTLAEVCLSLLVFHKLPVPGTWVPSETVVPAVGKEVDEPAHPKIRRWMRSPVRTGSQSGSPDVVPAMPDQPRILWNHAAQNWLTYMTRSNSEEDSSLQHLAQRLFDDRDAFLRWYSIWSPGTSYRSDKISLSPLFVATYLGLDRIVRGLLQAGCDVNEEDVRKDTALTWAIRNKQIAVAEVLLDVNADTELSSGHGTPLHVAVKADYIPGVKLLLARGAKCDSEDVTGATPLHYAQSTTVARFLLEYGGPGCLEKRNWNGHNPLLQASLDGRSKVKKLLLLHGVDLLAVRDTALEAARRKGDTDTVELLLNGDTVETLLEQNMFDLLLHRDVAKQLQNSDVLPEGEVEVEKSVLPEEKAAGDKNVHIKDGDRLGLPQD